MVDTNYTTYDQIGKAEDVSDVITAITPSDTPFLTAIGTEGIDSTNPQWQEDSLRAPAANKQVQGFDAVATARTPTVMRATYTQILADTFRVTETAERVKKYGRDSEIAYQSAKMGKELKKDLEFALVGATQNAAVGDGTSTPSALASVAGNSSGSGTPAMISTAVTDSNSGTARDINEDLILAVHQLLYNEGGDPTTLMVNPSDSLLISNFAGATGRERMIDGKKIVNAVEVYTNSFGTLKVVMNRILQKYVVSTTNGMALLYNPEMWKLLVLRNWKRVHLSKTGDNEKHMMVGEFSLKHKNFKATGLIKDLSGS